jgi:DNA repair protein RadC
MVTSQSDRLCGRSRCALFVRSLSIRVKSTLANIVGWLAISDRAHPYRQHLRHPLDAGCLRDWSGSLGLPTVCDDFWNSGGGAKTDDAKLLARAIGKRRLSQSQLALFDHCGNLPRIMLLEPSELLRLTGDHELCLQLEAIKELSLRLLASDEVKPLLADAHTLIRYLRADMGHLRTETFRAIFLDGYNRVISEETLWQGTISEVHIHTREVMRRALELDALALIVAHNHPSGVLLPSVADLKLTRELINAASALGLTLHDHLIITPCATASLRLDGFVEPWN